MRNIGLGQNICQSVGVGMSENYHTHTD